MLAPPSAFPSKVTVGPATAMGGWFLGIAGASTGRNSDKSVYPEGEISDIFVFMRRLNPTSRDDMVSLNSSSRVALGSRIMLML